MLSKEKDRANISFKDGFFFPFKAINEHWREFVLLTSIVSLITAAIVLFTGQCFLCAFSPEVAEYIFCSQAWWNVLINYMSIFFLLAFFVSRWQFIFAENKTIKTALERKLFSQDKRALLFVFIFFLLWAIIGIGAAFLQIRQPNPNWLIELAFFVGVSLIMLFSAILLFNFVIFEHFLQGGSFFVLNKTFWPILDNIYKYIIWFLLYVILFSYLFQITMRFISLGGVFSLVRIFVMEFCLYFLVYTIAAVFMTSLYYQEKILLDKK